MSNVRHHMTHRALFIALLAVASAGQQARAEQTFVSLDVRILSCKLERVPSREEPTTSGSLKKNRQREATVFRGAVEEVILGPSPRLGRFVADADVPTGVPKRGEKVILSVPKTSQRFCKEAPGQARRFTLSRSCEESDLQSRCYQPFSEAKAVEDEE